MGNISSSFAQCTGNTQLTSPNGQSIPNTYLPNQVKINLQNGINYLNVSGADINNLQVSPMTNYPVVQKYWWLMWMLPEQLIGMYGTKWE